MTAHEPSSTLPLDEKGRLKYLFPADELTWACYAPVLDLCNDMTGRQPPLVFLHGGLSPYALSRDRSFVAEDVPGEALSGRTYDPILQHLPFAVIGVPWYQLAHLPDIPVVARNWTHGRAGFPAARPDQPESGSGLGRRLRTTRRVAGVVQGRVRRSLGMPHPRTRLRELAHRLSRSGPADHRKIRHWVAAARYLYDLSPERYAANGHGNVLLKNVKTLIQPGVRAGEPVATSQDKDDIFHLAMQCGREQFRSFAAWVNVPLST